MKITTKLFSGMPENAFTTQRFGRTGVSRHREVEQIKENDPGTETAPAIRVCYIAIKECGMSVSPCSDPSIQERLRHASVNFINAHPCPRLNYQGAGGNGTALTVSEQFSPSPLAREGWGGGDCARNHAASPLHPHPGLLPTEGVPKG